MDFTAQAGTPGQLFLALLHEPTSTELGSEICCCRVLVFAVDAQNKVANRMGLTNPYIPPTDEFGPCFPFHWSRHTTVKKGSARVRTP